MLFLEKNTKNIIDAATIEENRDNIEPLPACRVRSAYVQVSRCRENELKMGLFKLNHA